MAASTKDILLYTNKGLSIYKRYIKNEFTLGKSFSSPLRKDKSPSFSIYYHKTSNKYLFKDFARDDIKGDAIRFVELLFALSYTDAINKICFDFNINNLQANSMKVTEKLDIQEKMFSKQELSYFLEYGINEKILSRFNVKSVLKYSIKNRWSSSSETNPIFYYKFDWGGKIYQPKNKFRFHYHGNKPQQYIFGLDQLPKVGKLLIITGGEKDVLTFSALGYNAMAFNSESANIENNVLSLLMKRFKYIAVCYDADLAGKKASAEVSKKHSIANIKLPLSGAKTDKDISDYIRNGCSKDELYRLIYNAINQKFIETLRLLHKHTFSELNKVIKPVPVLNIDGHNVLSFGNIMVLAGKVKTGKSAVLYSILAGALSEKESDMDTLGINIVPNTDKKAVIHFDTEQSEYDWHTRLMSSLERAKIERKPNFFNSYHILEFTFSERIKHIEDIIEFNFREHNGIHLVMIDGVADLIKSVNDEERSNEIVDLFHRLSVEYKCPVILVVHLNPDGNKTRGHLGSQLDRKAESVINIEREGDICTINPRYTRNANAIEIPLMQFTWDNSSGRHISLGSKSGEQKKEKRIDEAIDILDEIFTNGNSEIPKSDFKEQLSEKMEIKRSATYNTINFMITEKLITEFDSDKKEKIIARCE